MAQCSTACSAGCTSTALQGGLVTGNIRVSQGMQQWSGAPGKQQCGSAWGTREQQQGVPGAACLGVWFSRWAHSSAGGSSTAAVVGHPSSWPLLVQPLLVWPDGYAAPGHLKLDGPVLN